MSTAIISSQPTSMPNGMNSISASVLRSSPRVGIPLSIAMAPAVACPVDHARQQVDEGIFSSGSSVSDVSTESPKVEFAVAFDIDGVLLKGGEVIPEAKEALRMLNGENEDGIVVPYIFLTNGGGKLEQDRCKELSDKLEVPVSTSQFIQGHTPMRNLVELYNTVLVVGGVGDTCRKVAETYGFKDVITPGDIIAWKPDCVPFRTLTEEELKSCHPRDFTKVDIQAILVFADSRDWAGDQQIIIELLTSVNGRMGTVSKTSQEGPPLYYSHGDVVWATSYSLPRFGMGALRKCIETLYTESTGKDLGSTLMGKPHSTTYKYATQVLTEWRREIHNINKDPTRVYMIGDSPFSDIRGANQFGWISILVRTGVFQGGENAEDYPARSVQNNVLDAVKWALANEKLPENQRIS
ncbi:putative CDP-alcohol phosphatidyltransferase class-I family protein [Neolecta irregularis DAH-3]|uniref:Putative CDP-alcohol phosphatidyltransferase class-I family protein n=1 Tax=Neolecta irregularis (strain DAH-3) TaxID=1198029 RepID=A0A1U7LSW0_NEOID|nr:putative CDP-alcohol phosphatidyltransferase class-I family protein [Neolecta irregularis DAH-3]|eukprot:OLL25734.1 putative CDP-alcohol phosphatidyltransferase class-I family protein [Neolecta irregularis DAH-3]